MALVKLAEIVALQQGIGKLGIGNALVLTLQALLHGVALDHGVDREMLADVAQEIEAVHAAEPVMVIRHAGRVIALEAEERGDLVADVVDPAGNHFGGVQLAFAGLEAGVADHAGGAADQGDRAVPGILEAFEDQHRHQVAQMQAVRRRIEAAIERDLLLAQQLVECLRVGQLRDQTARVQVLEKGGLVHYGLRLAGAGKKQVADSTRALCPAAPGILRRPCPADKVSVFLF